MSISEAELAAALESGTPVAEETPAEPVVEEAPPAEAETEAEPSPVQKYLEKYGGDVDKALAAAAEAQSLIGRQGGELGELRQELAAIREAVTPQEPQLEYNEQTSTWAQEIGAAPNFYEGADYALQKGNTQLYDEIMETAYLTYPKEAARYEIALAQRTAQQQLMSQIGPVLAPVQQRTAQEQFTEAWRSVATQIPDLSEFTPQLLEVAQQNPEMLQALQSPDQTSRERVIRNLYAIAKFGAAAPLSAATAQAVQDTTAQAEALRRAAAVGQATSQGPGTPPAEETLAGGWLDKRVLHEEMGLTPEDLEG